MLAALDWLLANKGAYNIRVVNMINKDGFKGKPPADCYMCHRGKAVPDYKEKLDEYTVRVQLLDFVV